MNNPKIDESIMKVDVERFGCNNHLLDFEFMKNIIKIAMDDFSSYFIKHSSLFINIFHEFKALK